jgi:hypothetical protein
VLRGALEHLKIETRLIDERFASVMVECVMFCVIVSLRGLKLCCFFFSRDGAQVINLDESLEYLLLLHVP